MKRASQWSLSFLAVAALTVTAACGSGTGGADRTAGGTANGTVAVVTSTNVYGAIASAIGGDTVSVTAILADPSADPHSYEASPQDQVTIAKAQLVIANGGGYDDFVTQMVDAAPDRPILLDAVKISGLDADDEHADGSAGTATDSAPSSAAQDDHEHDHGAFNEHVFYSLPSMQKLGDTLATELGTLDPSHAATYTANARKFSDQLAALQQQAAAIRTQHAESTAVVTEPVADYLLAEAGVKDVTPESFAEAVESENDPSAADLAAVSSLIADKKISVLVFNEQTSGPVISKVLDTARSAGVPVLPVTETLPQGVTDYPSWIGGTLDSLATSLG